MFRPLLIIAFLLTTTCSLTAQVVVGDRPSSLEEKTAKQTIAKLDPKRFTMELGDFEELIPKQGSKNPYRWVSNNTGVLKVFEIEAGQPFGIIGRRRGTNTSPYELHTFKPRTERWALIVFKDEPVQLYGKDGKPVPITGNITILKNGENGTPDIADEVVITLGNSGPVTPIDPVVPVDPDKPDVKPDPATDTELVKQFKAALAVDKAAAAAAGFDWKFAPIWAKTYHDTSGFLKNISDPAIAPKTVADLYAKHKATWLVEGVPARPFLEKSREVVDGLFMTAFGKDPSASVDRTKASELFKRIANALTEALK